MRLRHTLPLFSAALLLASPLHAADKAAPLTRADVEGIVKQVIMENPQLLIDSVQKHQAEAETRQVMEAVKNLDKYQADLKNDKASPTAGNPKGDITIVEFFDYHCGYCKQMLPVVSQVMEEDKNVRVIFKEFPILSEDSLLASKAALAVYRLAPGKYFQYHSELMKHGGAFDEAYLTETAKSLGVNAEKFAKELNHPDVMKEIEKNRDLANSIGIRGTPALVINTQLIPGAVGVEDLKAKIKAEREAKKK